MPEVSNNPDLTPLEAGWLRDVALDNFDAAILLVDRNGIIQFRNNYPDSFAMLVDKPLHIGDSIFSAIPAQWTSMANSMFQNVVKSASTINTGATCRGEMGGKLHFEIRCKPVITRNPYPALFQVEVTEVTTQKIFEKKLSALAQEITSLIENANAVIIETDSREYITQWNKMASQRIGYHKNEAYARRLTKLIAEEPNLPDFSRLLTNVLDGRPLVNHEMKVRAKSGKLLDFLINANPKMNPKGKVIGISMIGHDITELVTYRQSLEKKVDERTRELNHSFEEIKVQKSRLEEEQKKSDELLRNILPDRVAAKLKESGQVEPQHYRLATVLFADLVGFTVLGKGLSPEVMLDELSNIFTGFDLILEQFNLEKIKTMGDGYMAVGGVPESNESNPVDAVRAGLAMIDFVQDINRKNSQSGKPPWSLRVGLNSGELVAGVIGKKKFAYDVWGSTVNVASRMDAAGKANCVNISETTYQLVKNDFHCVYRGEIETKNMGKMNMYLVEEQDKLLSL